jgi:23S rRNA pseudouridine1911/1915/1917 synthase
MSAQTYHLAAEHEGLALPQVLKRLLPKQSWSQIRKLIAGRHVQVNGNLCLDEGRRVRAGDVLKLADHPLAKPADMSDIRIVYLDEHLVVVQKPAGVTTLRHREETDLPQRRKQLQPTLDELLPQVLAAHLGIRSKLDPPGGRGSGSKSARPAKERSRNIATDPRLVIRPVHRLDRDTSGLMVFARTAVADQRLVRMFAKHVVQRAYVAVAHGRVEAQTIDTWLVRDRGDGLRGSSPLSEAAEGARRAITHLRPMEYLPGYTIVECRLETGRTHQIRIHLSERGHMLCGEKTYTHQVGGKPQDDTSRAPRHALHAAELAFLHPITNQPLRFQMPLPKDLRDWLPRLRTKRPAPDNSATTLP